MGVAIAVAAGGALFSSMMGGEQQKKQNQIQRAQHAEQEYQRAFGNQVKNREIANANAHKWMQNLKIGEAASKSKAEEEFWLKYNFDNASGEFSRQYQKVNSSIVSSIKGRNINPKSGTAQAILRQTMTTARKGMTSRGVQLSNAFVSAARKQQQLLSKRDFGYQGQESFLPGQLIQQSDSDIMSSALTSGLVAGAFAGASAGYSAYEARAQVDATLAEAGKLNTRPSTPSYTVSPVNPRFA